MVSRKFVGVLLAVGVGGGVVSVLLSYERRLAVLEQALHDGALAERLTEPPGSREMRRGSRGAMRGAPLDPPGFRGKIVPPKGPPRGVEDSELDRGMKEQVRGVIREERRELEEEQREQFRAMFTERVESRMNRFAEEFDVPEEQREELTGALLSELDASMQLRNEARSGDKSMDEVRSAIRALREQTSDRAKELLSETQFEAFQEGRRGPGGGGGPPWGGGRFGRGR